MLVASATAGMRRSFHAGALLVLVFVWGASSFCLGQAPRILCDQGLGNFSSRFKTGVQVSVGASRLGGFGTRTCDATLQWDQNKVLPVAQRAWQIDIDVMGADLGLGSPVVAFQMRRSDIDNLMTYQIYSLQKPPQLLRTITGGDYYDARDFNLQGHNEIWTDDAKAVDGFDGLPLTAYDYAPTVVLRFEKSRLIDVSPEYQTFYDDQIAGIKGQLDLRSLSDFKNSDGKLFSQPSSTTDIHSLLRTKIKVLEIVWSYLNSGREEQAWGELAEMWPPADLDRIHAAIVNARSHGILSQVDGVMNPRDLRARKHHTRVFEMNTENDPTRSATGSSAAGNLSRNPLQLPGSDNAGDATYTLADTRPEAIFLGIPGGKDESPLVTNSEVLLDLVVDAAGKVQSAELANMAEAGPAAEALLKSSSTWNFIPAYRGAEAVACRIRLAVRPQQ